MINKYIKIKKAQSNPPIKFKEYPINKEYEHESVSNIIQVYQIKANENIMKKSMKIKNLKKIKYFFLFIKK